MKNILLKIYESKVLTTSEAYKLFQFIINDEINDIQLTAILIAMKIRGESYEEILGAVNACLEKTYFFPKVSYMHADIVGTGGDMKNTINISTTSAFVAAACGLKIAKHCNHSISSQTGSLDILNYLGININTPPELSKKNLDDLNICFLSAPQYHTGFRNVSKIRKILKTKTLFNIIGPLLNPLRPSRIVIGVYNKYVIPLMIKILYKLNYKRAIVMHSNHSDEVTLFGKTYISELNNKKIISYTLESKDFGMRSHNDDAIQGGSVQKNCHIIKNILQGNGSTAHNETIAANVALLLKVFGNENIKENAQYALDIICSGKTDTILQSLIDRNHNV